MDAQTTIMVVQTAMGPFQADINLLKQDLNKFRDIVNRLDEKFLAVKEELTRKLKELDLKDTSHDESINEINSILSGIDGYKEAIRDGKNGTVLNVNSEMKIDSADKIENTTNISDGKKD